MLEFNVESMTCGHCVSRVTQAVKSADPSAVVEVDLAAHKVRVGTDADRQTVADALTEAGYPPS
jgi:copper chaperone